MQKVFVAYDQIKKRDFQAYFNNQLILLNFIFIQIIYRMMEKSSYYDKISTNSQRYLENLLILSMHKKNA